MPSSETIELRKVKGVLGAKDDLPEVSPRSSVVSRIRSMILRLSGVPQLIHLYGSLEPNKTITFDTGENDVRALFSDGIHLYAGLNTAPGKVIKFDLSTFTVVSTLTLDAGESNIRSLFSDGTYLYAGLVVSPSKIVKINLSTFTKVSTLDFSAGVIYIQSLFADGTYLYAGINTSPGKVVKVNLDTFTVDSTLTFGAGENDLRSLYSDGTYLYAGLGIAPGTVIKVDLSTFSKVSTLAFSAGENNINPLFSDGTYLYAGLITSPGKIIKIDLNTFSKVSTLTLDAGENNAKSLFSDGTFLYAGISTTPGKIIKIDLSTFAKVSTITLSVGEDYLYSLFSDGTYLYAGAAIISPGKVVRRYIIPTPSLFERAINLISEQTHSGNSFVYPSLASAITITSSAVAWTMGNYTEVVPVNTIKTMFYLTGIIVNNMIVDSEYEIDVATGLAASESVVGTFAHETQDTNLSCIISINPPIKISSNTRIACRAATENAAGDTCTIKVMYKQ